MDIINVNEKNFEEEVLKSNFPVLVDFWAVWCGPCKMLAPMVEEIAKESDKYKVVKLNIDESPRLLQEYKIVSVPTLVVFKDGKEVNRSVGLISKSEILNLL